LISVYAKKISGSALVQKRFAERRNIWHRKLSKIPITAGQSLKGNEIMKLEIHDSLINLGLGEYFFT
jgi:hypothetical protein